MYKSKGLLLSPYGKKILFYTIPFVITSVLQQLFNVADIAVVGRFAGEAAMAAVGSNTPIINLIINLFIGVGLGANVIISRCIGSGDRNKISRTVHTALLSAVIAGIILAIIGELLAGRILLLTGVPDDVLPMASVYLRIYIFGLPVVLLYNFITSIFRAKGDTKTPFIVLIVAGIINIILNVIFVKNFNMSSGGVALATIISNLISSVTLLIIMYHSDDDTRLIPSRLVISKGELMDMLQIGIPAGLQGCMFSFANILVQTAINSLGSVVMAASSAAFNVEVLVYFIFSSFGQATTTFSSLYYGARNRKKCKDTLCIGIGWGMIFTIVAVLLLGFNGRFIISIFNDNPQVIALGYQRLLFLLPSYFFSVFLECCSGYVKGFGKTIPPFVVSFFGICVFRIIWLNTAFKAFPVFSTICLVYPLTLGFTGLCMLAMVQIIRPAHKYIEN